MSRLIGDACIIAGAGVRQGAAAALSSAGQVPQQLALPGGRLLSPAANPLWIDSPRVPPCKQLQDRLLGRTYLRKTARDKHVPL